MDASMQLNLPLPGLDDADGRGGPLQEVDGSVGNRVLNDSEFPNLKDHGVPRGKGWGHLSGEAYKMEAMGTLASGIAHDFNNILTPIFLRIEMALAELAQEMPLRSQLEQILACSHRARDLVQQILNFSHANERERRPLQIALVVKEMLKLVRASLPVTVEIRQNIRGGGMVLADLGLIHMLMIELCVRSAQAMVGTGGLMEVSLEEVEIDPQQSARPLFLPKGLYVKLQVKQTKNRKGATVGWAQRDEGEGPDVALVSSIVEHHGGKMEVCKESEDLTVFHVYLPRWNSGPSARGEEASFSPRGSGTILLVDDEEAVVETLQQLLTHLGYTVVSTTSSERALEILREAPKRLDVMITDQTMPRMTGMELATEAVRIRPDLPVLLCSGLGEVLQDYDLKKAGVRELLVKPLTAGQVANKLREVLDRKAPL